MPFLVCGTYDEAKVSASTKILASAILALAIGWSPSCAKRTPQHIVVAVYRRTFDEQQPQFHLYLLGAAPNEVHFEQLLSRAGKREGPATRLDILGTGSITWRFNRIEVRDGTVQVNGKELPKAEFNGFVISGDGTVASGFIRTAD